MPITLKNVCPRCKSNLTSEVVECPHCGYSPEKIKASAQKRMASRKKVRFSSSKKVLKTVAKFSLLIALLVVGYNYFFVYSDKENDCHIKIRPGFTELTNITMKNGLKYLKENHPEEYKNTCENVEVIHPRNGCGGFGGGCFYADEPETIVISTTFGNTLNAAKVIIHETCHVMQFKEDRPLIEEECYEKDSVIPWNYPQDRIH